MYVSVMICFELPIVREGLHKLLDVEFGIDVVGVTDNLTEAIILAREHRPDVIVTGLTLGAFTGLDLVERIGREGFDPPPRFLVYATIDDNDMLTEVLRAEINGLLASNASPEEMILAVKVAARGQAMLGPGAADRLLSWFRSTGAPAAKAMPDRAVRSLTPREREVLLLTASGLSIDEIARRLYIGVTTVRTHIYRVRCKLQVKDRAQMVSLAYQAGLMQAY